MEKQLFCARCQIITAHSAAVDSNGEYVFTCKNLIEPETPEGKAEPCGRFVKFPSDIDKATFIKLADEYAKANEGQVSIEKQEKKLASFFEDDETPPQG